MIEITKEGDEYVLTVNDPELKKKPKELRFDSYEKMLHWLNMECPKHFGEVKDEMV